MTIGQINLSIKNINIRTHNKLAINANFHGHKMKLHDREEELFIKTSHESEGVNDHSSQSAHENYMADLREP